MTVSAAQDGTYNLDLVSSGHGIRDAANNLLNNTTPTTGTDETYTVSTTVIDNTNPRLASIERYNPASQNTTSQSLIYRATFNESVTGVDTSDFVLSLVGSNTDTGSITEISGSGSVYNVTVSAAQDGTYNLDLVSSGHGIRDAANNLLNNTTPTTGTDETYTVSTTVIDNTNPRLASIERYNPASQNTTSQSLIYRATFSENVTGVDASDFILSPDSTWGGNTSASTGQFMQTRSPDLAIPDLTTVSDTVTVSDSETATSVSVAVNITHNYIGDLKIDLIAPDGTTKTLHNRTGSSTDNIIKTYAPDFGGVLIAGIWTLQIYDGFGVDPGVLNSWTLTVNYGNIVTITDVTDISSSDDVYYVTVSATQDGTYNLDLVSPGHGIEDIAKNPLTSIVPTSGTDHTYTVSTVPADATAPTLASIERYNPAAENTDSQTLVYKVTFSENVTGVDTSDFTLSPGSTGNGTGSGQFTQTRTPAITIPYDQIVTDTILVTGSGTATSVSVAVDIAHQYIDDLKVDLIAPDGTVQTLHERSSGPANIDQTYAPDFGSTSIAGNWTLQMHDYYSADDGILNRWTLTVNHDSDTATHVTSISGSGSVYYVTVSAAQDGTYNLDLVSSGHGIRDAANNLLNNTTPTTGTDETYTVSTTVIDNTNPRLASIERYNPASQNTTSQSLIYRATFNESVTGVDTSDFVLSLVGSNTDTGSITEISGSGSVYNVTVSAAQDGTYNLDLVSSGHGIRDAANNLLNNTTPTTGTDETYTVSTTVIDNTNPRLASIERYNPASQNTTSQSLIYRATFSENVTGVDASDFILSPDSTWGGNTSASTGQFMQTRSPDLAIPDLTTVSDTVTVSDSETATSVSVAVNITHNYIGDLKIDLIAPDGTTKTLHNRTGSSTDNIIKTYAPDFGGVLIAGIWTLQIYDGFGVDPGVLNSWTLTVNYGNIVTITDVTDISSSDDVYYVTVSATQDGTYNLDLVSPGHGIEDIAKNPLTSIVPTSGTDHTYTVSTVPADATAPTLASIERYNPAAENTDSQTLVYKVTFSENVTGVDTSDFTLSPGSTGNGTGSGQFTQTRTPAITIPYDQIVTDTILVTGSGTATSVSVAVDIAHQYIDDLKVDLIAPDGTVQTLHERSSGPANIDQTYAPDFGSTSIAGNWTLQMHDYYSADDGILNRWTLTVNHDSDTATHVTSISGSGSVYYVTVSAAQDGTYNLDLVSSGHGIRDAANNLLNNTTPTTGTDETYTVSTTVIDNTNPRLASIERYNPASKNTTSQSLIYRATFNESVTGVDTSDFVLSLVGSNTDTGSITEISGSGSVYNVTVSAAQDGTYNLDLVSSGHGIRDAANNLLNNTTPTTGTDETYTVSTTVIDNTNPRLASIERYNPASQNTTSQSLIYRATFSENVTGVDASDFILSPDSTWGGNTSASTGQFMQTRSPDLAIPDLTTVSDTVTVSDSETATSVSVAVNITHNYIGDLKIDLIAPDGTTKTLHNRTGSSTDNIIKTYAPDFGGVLIAGIWTLQIYDGFGVDPGVLNSWTLTVNYGNIVTITDVTDISSSDDVYYVTVSATQDGTYNLDLVSPGHGIEDIAKNPLTSIVPTSGTDHTYTVSTVPADATAPTLASIERYNPAAENTDSQTLVYKVTFSENVTGVDTSDFTLSPGSTGNGTGSGQFTQTRTPAITIPYDQIVTDTILVTGSGTATSVSVAVDIAHQYIDDLKVDLIAPDGTVSDAARALKRSGQHRPDLRT